MAEASIWANATVSAVAGAIAGGGISLLIAVIADAKNRFFVRQGAVSSAIEDLRVLACSYWRSAGKNEVAESGIKSSLERLDLRLQALLVHSRLSNKKLDITGALDELSNVTTGGSFEEAQRVRDLTKVHRIKEISSRLTQLIE